MALLAISWPVAAYVFLVLGITFGLNLTVEQVAIINALVVAGLGLLVRQAVTPTASPELKAGTAVKVQGTDAITTVG